MQNFREKYAYKVSLYLLLITIAVPVLNAIPYFISGVDIFVFPVNIIYFICALIFSSSVLLRIYSKEVSKRWVDVYMFLAGAITFLLSKYPAALFIFCGSSFQDWGLYSYDCPGPDIFYLLLIHKKSPFLFFILTSMASIVILIKLRKRENIITQ
ncbi:MAG: hypothetical protein KBC41_00285 [Candidatus Pacebacteria bacterium]|nr:hypothetical protein [Candidatus Paceibacterota bacterium]MBP9866504.1 hypothetical protein [Candidatus Paceibacterota bacterium]